jgi:endoglucanase
MHILSKASDYRAIYMRFNLAPVSGSVTSAKLRLYTQEWRAGTATDTKVAVRFVSNDTWSETGITWNNKPATGDVLSAGVSDVNNSYIEIDLTSKVQTELSGDKNISLYIYVPNTWADPWDMRTNITSKEGTNKPQLSITTSAGARLAAAGSRTISPEPADALSIYPNPVTGGSITMKATGLGPDATYAIIDAWGKTLAVGKAQNELSIPERYFPNPGVYLLQVRDGAMVKTRRIVIGR